MGIGHHTFVQGAAGDQVQIGHGSGIAFGGVTDINGTHGGKSQDANPVLSP
jgi:hypothetical protein